MWRSFRAMLILVLIIGVDLGSKAWIQKEIPLIQPFSFYPFGGIGIVQAKYFTFSIVHTFNTGTAWSLLSQYPFLLLCLRSIVIAGLAIYLVWFNKDRKREIALLCILGGALGNYIEVIIHKSVTDFFYLIFYRYDYPVFNIADAVIFCSFLYLVIHRPTKRKPS